MSNYFENLLPDSQHLRQKLQARYQTSSTQAFDLLTEIGRDCVGALQLLEEGQTPVLKVQAQALSDSEIENLLVQQIRGRGPLTQELRISLAGAQEKTALLLHEGAWKLPLESTPTTHIFKLPLGLLPNWNIDLSHSVDNEWLCHRILQELGVPVAGCQRQRFGSQEVLIVERFDRLWQGNHLLRLPQEDFCQALGYPPALKYESDGGPGIRTILEVLLGSSQAQEDRRSFFKTLVIFWMLAAIDGHAKNFSLTIGARGSYRLTPRYDVLSAHPMIGKGAGKLAAQQVKMAMKVWGKNSHYEWDRIRRHHWQQVAKDCGLESVCGPILEELLKDTPVALERVRSCLPTDFPSQVADSILSGVERTWQKLA